MKISKNKKATLIALFLTLTIAASLVAVLPIVKAQTLEYYPTFIFVVAAPNPVGVNQPTLIVTWTQALPPETPLHPVPGTVGGRAAWEGLTYTVTKPDGTKETLALGVTDPVGGGYYRYVPDTVGKYSVQAHFPAQWKNTTTFNRLYAAADSKIETFVVQQEQLAAVPGVPLPTEYWTRPIFAYNRDWSQIAGNWITGLKDLPYITGPDTAHVVWTEPYFFGGIAGGTSGSLSYHTGSAYEAKFSGATIMQGILYYNLNLGSSSTASQGKVVARDLRTGELLWEKNGTGITMSTIYDYESPNQHGVHPYLWVTGNRVIDPFSGTELFSFTNVPSGTEAVGQKGERLIYQWDPALRWLALWDFSAPLTMTGLSASGIAQFLIDKVETTSYWQWRPVGKQINGTTGYRWNATLPTNLPPRLSRDVAEVVYDADGAPEMLFCTSGAIDRYRTTDPFIIYAVSVEKGREGTLLWKTQFKMPFANATFDPSYGYVLDGENRVVAFQERITRQWYGFDLDTGNKLWGPTVSQPPYDYYSSYAVVAYGKFYTGSWSGILQAFDIKTGELLWTNSTDPCELEGPYENWVIRGTMAPIDGKIYLTTNEHSHTQPLYRTWKSYCFNATTGDRLWDLTGLWEEFAIADGYMVNLNELDEQIYTIGKGPSATTVAASPKISVHGNSVLVEGSVTDISAGTKSDALTARFPNGVPAVSDDSMTAWMEYVYMQMPKPTDATGVEVTLDAIDPNNNFVHIGTVTSDASGFYSYQWTPDVPGKYTVIATFAGSKSYWPSQTETSISVSEAPTPTQPEPAAPLPPFEMYTLYATIAIIIAVAIVGLMLVRILRKRP